MPRYLIIGKSPHMEHIFLLKNGHYHERCITRGQKITIDESEMNFHLRRRATRGLIKIVELEEEAPPALPKIEEPEIKSTIVLDEPPDEQTPAVKITEIDEEAPEKKKKKKPQSRKKSKTSEE